MVAGIAMGGRRTLLNRPAHRAHWCPSAMAGKLPFKNVPSVDEGVWTMAEPEFSATGVHIGTWLRPLTRAGQVLISDGRLRLLTSRGTEIDSAPVDRVEAGAPWYAARDSAHATLNGTRYLIGLGRRDDQANTTHDGHDRHAVRRFLDALHHARRGG